MYTRTIKPSVPVSIRAIVAIAKRAKAKSRVVCRAIDGMPLLTRSPKPKPLLRISRRKTPATVATACLSPGLPAGGQQAISIKEAILMLNQQIHILLVEDDDIDSEAIIRAFRQHKVTNPVQRVRNGLEALHILRGEAGYSRLPHPYMILTDLKMPWMGGLELIGALRVDPILKDSVVFALTSLEDHETMMKVYDLDVAGYFSKNMIDTDFGQVLQLLDVYQPKIQLPSPDGDV
jgi:CheY-like chemotaxis protein